MKSHIGLIIVLFVCIYVAHLAYTYYYAEISRITSCLYLGNLHNADDHKLLQKLGITHVLSVIDLKVDQSPSIEYKTIKVPDVPETQLD